MQNRLSDYLSSIYFAWAGLVPRLFPSFRLIFWYIIIYFSLTKDWKKDYLFCIYLYLISFLSFGFYY